MIIKWLLMLGLRKGLLKGNKFFLVVGVGAAVFRVISRLSNTSDKRLLKHRLKVGDVVTVRQSKNR